MPTFDDMINEYYWSFPNIPRDDTYQERLPLAMAQADINEGYVEFAKDTHCFTDTITVACVDAQLTYSYYTARADILEVYAVRYGTQEYDLAQTTLRELDDQASGWRYRTAGTPEFWYPQDGTKFGIYPPADVTAATNLTLYAYILPVTTKATPPATQTGIAELTDLADVFPLAGNYYLAPVYWGVAKRASRFLADREMADRIMAAALADYKRLVGGFNMKKL